MYEKENYCSNYNDSCYSCGVFNRQDGGYELVLVKNEETGEWSRPREIDKKVETKEYNLSLEVELELPEGLSLGNYQMA